MLDIQNAGLNLVCPKCGECVVFDLENKEDYAVCKVCGETFELSEGAKVERDAYLKLIRLD